MINSQRQRSGILLVSDDTADARAYKGALRNFQNRFICEEIASVAAAAEKLSGNERITCLVGANGVDHYESLIRLAAETDCSLILPAPLAGSPQEIRKRRQLIKKKKIQCALLFPVLFHPVLDRLREMLDSGAYGKCKKFNFERSAPYPPGCRLRETADSSDGDTETDSVLSGWLMQSARRISEDHNNLSIAKVPGTGKPFPGEPGLTREVTSGQICRLKITVIAACGEIRCTALLRARGQGAYSGSIERCHKLYGNGFRPVGAIPEGNALETGLRFTLGELTSNRYELSPLLTA